MADSSPQVRFQPCDSWEPAHDVTTGACAGCGWLEEDHWLADLERTREPVAGRA